MRCWIAVLWLGLCAAPCFAPQATLLDRLAAAKSDQERAALLESEGSSLNAALVDGLGKRGDQAFGRYDYPAAIELYRSMAAAAERLQDRAAIAAARYNIGRSLYRLGKGGEAIENLNAALAVAGPAHLDLRSAQVWRLLCTVYQQTGQLNQALDAADRSRRFYHAAGDVAGEGAALFNKGNVWFRKSQYRLASEAYEESLRLTEGRDATTVNLTLTNLASLYTEQGDYDVALSYLERVMHSAAYQKMDPRSKLVTLGILGTTYRRLNRYPEARQALESALALAQQTKDREQEAHQWANLATLLYYMGNNTEALADYKIANEIAAREHLPDLQAFSLSDVALTYLELHQPEQAFETAQLALEIARQLNSPTYLWEPLNTVGKACRALNRTADAEAAFRESISAIESVRVELAGGEQEGRSFFSGMLAPYYDLLAMKVEARDAEGALAMAEHVKARQLLDVLARGKTEITQAMSAEEKAREQALSREAARWNDALEAKAKPDAATLAAFEKASGELEAFHSRLYAAHPELKVRRGKADPLSIAQAAALVPAAGALILEFSVTQDDGVFLFVLEHSAPERPALSVYRLGVTGKRLATDIEAFRRQLAGRDLDYRSTAETLYRELLGPAQARLRDKSVVGIVPDGPLWDLPFQALVAPGGKSLLEQVAVFYAPSLTALRETIRPGRGPAASDRTLLAFGPPDASLPQATTEVRELAKLYGSAEVFTGAEASEQRWKAEAPDYRILHLATHGVLNSNNPLFSYLKLGRTSGGSDDGMLEAREIVDLNLRAELAVLSACETARGEFRGGEGLVGMSWALMMAGAPTVVVSQWKVDSASTTQLMLALYRNLRSGLSAAPIAGKAEALRKAAIAVAANPQYRHPFYWAGFAMVGNGY